MSKIDQVTPEESLSALLDGELDGQASERLIDVLEYSPKLQHQWRHYHMIRDLMRPKPQPPFRPHLSQLVMDQLEAEPTILMPSPSSTPTVHTGSWLGRSPVRALAASLAAIAVIGLAVVYSPNAPERTTVATNSELSPTVVKLDRDAVAAIERQRMEGYLARHAANSSNTNLHGFLPYARVVSYNGGAR